MKRVVAGFIGLAVVISAAGGARAQQKMMLGDVLVLRLSDSRPDGAASLFSHLLQADRGSRKGQYLLLKTTESREGSESRQPGAVGGAEYHLLGPSQVGTLPDVDVLGFHYTKVRPERREAFERFVSEKLHPAVANLRPDLRILYYKPVSGQTGGNYLAVFALTRESRDKYWPGGSDSDELRAAFSPAVRELTKELSTYLVEGSYAADPKLAAAVYESRDWTDFVLISPASAR